MTLLSQFPPDCIIHDAACGLGPVTEAILDTNPPNSISIYATDLVPGMVGIYNMFAGQKNWPFKAAVMDARKLTFKDEKFTHTFLSFGLPIIADPVQAASEMYRTLKPGGTAITAFWLQIPQGECAGETRRAIWGPDARLATQPPPEHKDPEFIRSLLVKGGFKFEDVQLYQKSAFLAVEDLDVFARAIWSAIGVPPGGWTKDDEERWDEAIETYKTLLAKKKGFSMDNDGKVVLEAIAQIAIVKKTA